MGRLSFLTLMLVLSARLFECEDACYEWTEWMHDEAGANVELSEKGEFQQVDQLRGRYDFCEDPIDIECGLAAHPHTPYDQTGQVNLTCNLENGFMCFHSDQPGDSNCLNYAIRVQCPVSCPTDAPATVSQCEEPTWSDSDEIADKINSPYSSSVSDTVKMNSCATFSSVSNCTTQMMSIVDKLDEVSFELHFHSRAHYVSADYYAELDIHLKNIHAISKAVVTTLGGAALMLPVVRKQSKNTIIQAFFFFIILVGNNAIEELLGTEENALEKTRLHNEAALETKQLEKEVALWIPPGNCSNVTVSILCEKYREIILNHSNIEKKIRSEDWTFSCVHFELSERMKEKAKRHKKYIPENPSACSSFIWIMICAIIKYVFCYGILLYCLPLLPIYFVLRSNDDTENEQIPAQNDQNEGGGNAVE
ncbi:uncharacterized protein [Ptychodera flava]|uniref:uncharacterized protein isoform X2 n=1 Tax=Ptychodera flava TaxID=63121 RepID=UPI00396A380B